MLGEAATGKKICVGTIGCLPVGDRNGEAAVVKNSSVAVMAASWAFQHGARQLMLVGVDYTGPHARMVRPFDSCAVGWRGLYDRPVPGGIDKQFAAAVTAVEAAGGMLLNLSPRTRLEAVPLAHWTSVLGQSHHPSTAAIQPTNPCA